MKLYWYGLEWKEDCYFFWFDWIENAANRLIGYEKIYIENRWHYMICFWFFCVIWSW